MLHHPRRSVSEASLFTLTPSKVSWASLFMLALIVFGAGLFSVRHVIVAQERHFLLHGIDHAKRIASNIMQHMQPQIEVGVTPEWVVESFQHNLTRLCNLETYSAFLLDEQTGRIVAHSTVSLIGDKLEDHFLRAKPFDLNGRRFDRGDTSRAIGAVTRDGMPTLVYFAPVRASDGQATRWTVVVQADVSDLFQHSGELAGHVSLVFFLTAILTVVIGFVSMRWLGRAYERQIEARLDQRTRQLDAAREEAVRKASLTALGKTASMLTHEMRNPLASIKLGLSGILGGDDLNERDRRRLDISIQEVDRLNGLLSGTLDFVRPISLSEQPLQMDGLLDRALATFDMAFSARGIRLQRQRCEACKPLRCDPDQLQQALLNLLNNAIEACPRDGCIEIGLEQVEGKLVLVVANDCEVAPSGEMGKYFDAFFTTKAKGSGLGLTIVRRIVEEHRGTVDFRVREDGRVQVEVALPIADR